MSLSLFVSTFIKVWMLLKAKLVEQPNTRSKDDVNGREIEGITVIVYIKSSKHSANVPPFSCSAHKVGALCM